MKSFNTFSISFNLRTDKADSNGTAPIYIRITVNGKRVEIATKKRFDMLRWDNGYPTGTKADAKNLKIEMESIKFRINQIYRELFEKNEIITAKKIKDHYYGLEVKSKTVMQMFEYHISNMKKMVGVQYAPATVVRFETCRRHIVKFLKISYQTDDMFLSELNYEFIAKMEYYFKVTCGCNHNTSMKYIKIFKTVINHAIKLDWLEKDPFKQFSITIEPVERDYLTNEELETIEHKKINIPRIELVRDIFIFCCYTGLAYIDVLNLKEEHIFTSNDEKFIQLKRTKTKTKSLIMLLPKALEIINKYKDSPKKNPTSILPVLTNQKMNAYLKEIADICGITKNITFHLARHTFATTVTLTNGVPIETVNAMIGHKRLQSTQIYAKVIEQKVKNDMIALREKLGR